MSLLSNIHAFLCEAYRIQMRYTSLDREKQSRYNVYCPGKESPKRKTVCRRLHQSLALCADVHCTKKGQTKSQIARSGKTEQIAARPRQMAQHYSLAQQIARHEPKGSGTEAARRRGESSSCLFGRLVAQLHLAAVRRARAAGRRWRGPHADDVAGASLPSGLGDQVVQQLDELAQAQQAAAEVDARSAAMSAMNRVAGRQPDLRAARLLTAQRHLQARAGEELAGQSFCSRDVRLSYCKMGFMMSVTSRICPFSLGQFALEVLVSYFRDTHSCLLWHSCWKSLSAAVSAVNACRRSAEAVAVAERVRRAVVRIDELHVGSLRQAASAVRLGLLLDALHAEPDAVGPAGSEQEVGHEPARVLASRSQVQPHSHRPVDLVGRVQVPVDLVCSQVSVQRDGHAHYLRIRPDLQCDIKVGEVRIQNELEADLQVDLAQLSESLLGQLDLETLEVIRVVEGSEGDARLAVILQYRLLFLLHLLDLRLGGVRERRFEQPLQRRIEGGERGGHLGVDLGDDLAGERNGVGARHLDIVAEVHIGKLEVHSLRLVGSANFASDELACEAVHAEGEHSEQGQEGQQPAELDPAEPVAVVSLAAAARTCVTSAPVLGVSVIVVDGIATTWSCTACIASSPEMEPTEKSATGPAAFPLPFADKPSFLQGLALLMCASLLAVTSYQVTISVNEYLANPTVVTIKNSDSVTFPELVLCNNVPISFTSAALGMTSFMQHLVQYIAQYSAVQPGSASSINIEAAVHTVGRDKFKQYLGIWPETLVFSCQFNDGGNCSSREFYEPVDHPDYLNCYRFLPNRTFTEVTFILFSESLIGSTDLSQYFANEGAFPLSAITMNGELEYDRSSGAVLFVKHPEYYAHPVFRVMASTGQSSVIGFTEQHRKAINKAEDPCLEASETVSYQMYRQLANQSYRLAWYNFTGLKQDCELSAAADYLQAQCGCRDPNMPPNSYKSRRAGHASIYFGVRIGVAAPTPPMLLRASRHFRAFSVMPCCARRARHASRLLLCSAIVRPNTTTSSWIHLTLGRPASTRLITFCRISWEVDRPMHSRVRRRSPRGVENNAFAMSSSENTVLPAMSPVTSSKVGIWCRSRMTKRLTSRRSCVMRTSPGSFLGTTTIRATHGAGPSTGSMIPSCSNNCSSLSTASARWIGTFEGAWQTGRALSVRWMSAGGPVKQPIPLNTLACLRSTLPMSSTHSAGSRAAEKAIDRRLRFSDLQHLLSGCRWWPDPQDVHLSGRLPADDGDASPFDDVERGDCLPAENADVHRRLAQQLHRPVRPVREQPVRGGLQVRPLSQTLERGPVDHISSRAAVDQHRQSGAVDLGYCVGRLLTLIDLEHAGVRVVHLLVAGLALQRCDGVGAALRGALLGPAGSREVARLPALSAALALRCGARGVPWPAAAIARYVLRWCLRHLWLLVSSDCCELLRFPWSVALHRGGLLLRGFFRPRLFEHICQGDIVERLDVFREAAVVLSRGDLVLFDYSLQLLSCGVQQQLLPSSLVGDSSCIDIDRKRAALPNCLDVRQPNFLVSSACYLALKKFVAQRADTSGCRSQCEQRAYSIQVTGTKWPLQSNIQSMVKMMIKSRLAELEAEYGRPMYGLRYIQQVDALLQEAPAANASSGAAALMKPFNHSVFDSVQMDMNSTQLSLLNKLSSIVTSNFVKLQVRADSNTVQSIIETHKYALSNVMSEIGGLLGLYLGWSAMTFVELLHLLHLMCRFVSYRLAGRAGRAAGGPAPDRAAEEALEVPSVSGSLKPVRVHPAGVADGQTLQQVIQQLERQVQLHFNPAGRLPDSLARVVGPPALHEAQTQLAQPPAKLVNSGALTTRPGRQRSEGRRGAGCRGGGQGGAVGLESLGAHLRVALADVENLTGCRDHRINLVHQIARRSPGLPVQEGGADEHGMVGENPQPDVSVANQAQLDAFADVQPGALGHVAAVHVAELAEAEPVAGGRVRVAVNGDAAPEQQLLLRYRRQRRLLRHRGCPGRLLLRHQQRRQRRRNSLDAAVIVRGPGVLVQAERRQLQAGAGDALVVVRVHADRVLLQVEGELALAGVPQLVLVQVRPAPDARVHHTCSRPSRVLGMVTQMPGWAPLLVTARISASSSSRLSLSFFTSDSTAFRLKLSESGPPCRWHISECTMDRQASDDVTGDATPTAENGEIDRKRAALPNCLDVRQPNFLVSSACYLALKKFVAQRADTSGCRSQCEQRAYSIQVTGTKWPLQSNIQSMVKMMIKSRLAELEAEYGRPMYGLRYIQQVDALLQEAPAANASSGAAALMKPFNHSVFDSVQMDMNSTQLSLLNKLSSIVTSNFVKLQVRADSNTVQSIIETHKYALSNVMSEIGGLLGLYLGWSAMTFVELLHLLHLMCRFVSYRLAGRAGRAAGGPAPDRAAEEALEVPSVSGSLKPVRVHPAGVADGQTLQQVIQQLERQVQLHFNPAGRLPDSLARVVGPPALHEAQTQLAQPPAKLVNSGALTTRPGRQRSEGRRGAGCRGGGQGGAVGLESLGAHLRVALADVENLTGCRDHRINLVHQIARRSPGLPVQEGGADEHGMVGENPQPDVSVANQAQLDAFADVQPGALGHVAAVHVAELAEAEPVAGGRVRVAVNGDAAPEQQLLLRYRRQRRLLRHRGCPGRLLLRHQQRRQRRRNSLDAAVIVRGPGVLVQAERRQLQAGAGDALVVVRVHADRVLLQVEGELALAGVPQLVLVQVRPAPDARVHHTCSRPSRVLGMVTQMPGWAPLLVTARISASSSSRLSLSFFTSDSTAFRLKLSESGPPCRWHISECTMDRQASDDVTGDATPTAENGENVVKSKASQSEQSQGAANQDSVSSAVASFSVTVTKPLLLLPSAEDTSYWSASAAAEPTRPAPFSGPTSVSSISERNWWRLSAIAAAAAAVASLSLDCLSSLDLRPLLARPLRVLLLGVDYRGHRGELAANRRPSLCPPHPFRILSTTVAVVTGRGHGAALDLLLFGADQCHLACLAGRQLYRHADVAAFSLLVLLILSLLFINFLLFIIVFLFLLLLLLVIASFLRFVVDAAAIDTLPVGLIQTGDQAVEGQFVEQGLAEVHQQVLQAVRYSGPIREIRQTHLASASVTRLVSCRENSRSNSSSESADRAIVAAAADCWAAMMRRTRRSARSRSQVRNCGVAVSCACALTSGMRWCTTALICASRRRLSSSGWRGGTGGVPGSILRPGHVNLGFSNMRQNSVHYGVAQGVPGKQGATAGRGRSARRGGHGAAGIVVGHGLCVVGRAAASQPPRQGAGRRSPHRVFVANTRRSVGSRRGGGVTLRGRLFEAGAACRSGSAGVAKPRRLATAATGCAADRAHLPAMPALSSSDSLLFFVDLFLLVHVLLLVVRHGPGARDARGDAAAAQRRSPAAPELLLPLIGVGQSAGRAERPEVQTGQRLGLRAGGCCRCGLLLLLPVALLVWTAGRLPVPAGRWRWWRRRRRRHSGMRGVESRQTADLLRQAAHLLLLGSQHGAALLQAQQHLRGRGRGGGGGRRVPADAAPAATQLLAEQLLGAHPAVDGLVGEQRGGGHRLLEGDAGAADGRGLGSPASGLSAVIVIVFDLLFVVVVFVADLADFGNPNSASRPDSPATATSPGFLGRLDGFGVAQAALQLLQLALQLRQALPLFHELAQLLGLLQHGQVVQLLLRQVGRGLHAAKGGDALQQGLQPGQLGLGVPQLQRPLLGQRMRQQQRQQRERRPFQSRHRRPGCCRSSTVGDAPDPPAATSWRWWNCGPTWPRPGPPAATIWQPRLPLRLLDRTRHQRHQLPDAAQAVPHGAQLLQLGAGVHGAKEVGGLAGGVAGSLGAGERLRQQRWRKKQQDYYSLCYRNSRTTTACAYTVKVIPTCCSVLVVDASTPAALRALSSPSAASRRAFLASRSVRRRASRASGSAEAPAVDEAAADVTVSRSSSSESSRIGGGGGGGWSSSSSSSSGQPAGQLGAGLGAHRLTLPGQMQLAPLLRLLALHGGHRLALLGPQPLLAQQHVAQVVPLLAEFAQLAPAAAQRLLSVGLQAQQQGTYTSSDLNPSKESSTGHKKRENSHLSLIIPNLQQLGNQLVHIPATANCNAVPSWPPLAVTSAAWALWLSGVGAALRHEQRRYDQVMGDREPKITDKRFAQELQQKLEDKQRMMQQQKERRLAEAESRRVRKLVLDGVIEPGEAKGAAAAGEGRRGRDAEWKEFWPPNPYKTLAEYEEEKKRKADEAGRQPHSEPAETQKLAESEPATEEAQATSAAATAGEHRAAESAAPAGRYEGTQSPRIEELMREEDLDQLYSKASQIVYIMTPPAKRQQAANAYKPDSAQNYLAFTLFVIESKNGDPLWPRMTSSDSETESPTGGSLMWQLREKALVAFAQQTTAHGLRYLSYPVSTEFSRDGANFEFPSVTICPTNMFAYACSAVVSNHSVSGWNKCLVSMMEGSPYLFSLLNRTDWNASMPKNPVEFYPDGKNSIRAMVYRGHLFAQAYESVIYCRYKNEDCTFENFTEYKDEDRWWCFSFNPSNHTVIEVGEGKGLYLVLHLRGDAYLTYEQQVDYVPGFRVVLHQAGFKPDLNMGFNAPYGQKTSVQVKAETVTKVSRKGSPCSDELPNITYTMDYSWPGNWENQSFFSTTEDCVTRLKQEEFKETCGCLSANLALPSDLMDGTKMCHDLPEEVQQRLPAKAIAVYLLKYQEHRLNKFNMTEYVIKLNNSWIEPLADYVLNHWHWFNNTKKLVECYHRVESRQKTDGVRVDKCPVRCSNTQYKTVTTLTSWPKDVPLAIEILKSYTSKILARVSGTGLRTLRLEVLQNFTYASLSQAVVNLTAKNLASSRDFISVLDVYPASTKASVFTESFAYPLRNLFSDFGGILGLWIGVSVITLTEMLELVINMAQLASLRLNTAAKKLSAKVQPQPEVSADRKPEEEVHVHLLEEATKNLSDESTKRRFKLGDQLPAQSDEAHSSVISECGTAAVLRALCSSESIDEVAHCGVLEERALASVQAELGHLQAARGAVEQGDQDEALADAGRSLGRPHCQILRQALRAAQAVPGARQALAVDQAGRCEQNGDWSSDEADMDLCDGYKIQVQDYEGHRFLAIRRFYPAEGGLKPGIPGFNLNLYQWEKLKQLKRHLVHSAVHRHNVTVKLGFDKLVVVSGGKIWLKRLPEDCTEDFLRRNSVLLTPALWLELWKKTSWIEDELKGKAEEEYQLEEDDMKTMIKVEHQPSGEEADERETLLIAASERSSPAASSSSIGRIPPQDSDLRQDPIWYQIRAATGLQGTGSDNSGNFSTAQVSPQQAAGAAEHLVSGDGVAGNHGNEVQHGLHSRLDGAQLLSVRSRPVALQALHNAGVGLQAGLAQLVQVVHLVRVAHVHLGLAGLLQGVDDDLQELEEARAQSQGEVGEGADHAGLHALVDGLRAEQLHQDDEDLVSVGSDALAEGAAEVAKQADCVHADLAAT
uniref:PC4 domain-containing protein n=1 Tax=Macrostomum lignano TaxID=282301 RepID=A0A1I8GHC3_9PLAT